MFKSVNVSELFVETHNIIAQKYKRNNGSIKEYTPEKRYLELLEFVSNSCYWVRFNKDYNKKINKEHDYINGRIPGNYLNEIHLFYVKYDFYNLLYTKLLYIWLRITNYKTLSIVSDDSAFVRNILGINCKRNPQYYNKPGLKIHAITDTHSVPISLTISDCTDHDSNYVRSLLDNKFIDNATFYNNVQYFLADSAYSSLSNIVDVTDSGINIIMGRNKQHITKTTITNEASVS
jgi:hypothetical protein